MTITIGIAAAIMLVLTVAKYITKRCYTEADKYMMKLHDWCAYIFVLLGFIHMLLSFKVFEARYLMTYITGAICILLGFITCVACKRHKKKGKDFRKYHQLAAVLMVVFLVSHVVITMMSFNAYQQKIKDITYSDIEISSVADGTYEGEYNAGYIYAKVAVEVKEGKLINIKILEHRNERGAKAEQITDNMITAQSLEVDAISGATNSSKVIRKAVENALKNN